MLATRIIPTLLCRGRQLIKGAQFASWRSVGVAMQAARIHSARGVDELILLDIGATPEGRGPDLSLIEELSATCFMPLTVGGGVRTVDDVNALLRAGADKVAIGTAAVDDPHLIERCADHFGAQAIVVSIDHIDGAIATHCGGKRWAFVPPIKWAREVELLGAGEILLTDIDGEGTLEGYDVETLARVCAAVSIPVVAHGGCGTYHHMLEAIRAGASAVAAGAMFQFTDQTPAGAAQYLHANGVTVRLREAA